MQKTTLGELLHPRHTHSFLSACTVILPMIIRFQECMCTRTLVVCENCAKLVRINSRSQCFSKEKVPTKNCGLEQTRGRHLLVAIDCYKHCPGTMLVQYPNRLLRVLIASESVVWDRRRAMVDNSTFDDAAGRKFMHWCRNADTQESRR